MNFRSLNLIWNWNRINQMKNRKWHSCTGLDPLWLSGQPSSNFSGPFGHLAQELEQGKASGFTGWRWPAKFRWLPVTRCSGEGSGSKLAGRQTGFGVAERRELIGGACPQRRKNVDKSEWGSTVGSEWWERNSLAAGSSGWGRGGSGMARGGRHRWCPRLNRGWRRWPSAHKLWVGKRWWRHALDANAWSSSRRSDRATDKRAPHGLLFSQNF
jgi:hypothetical protein